MTEPNGGRSIQAEIQGDVSGQLAIGENIRQQQSVGQSAAAVAPEEIATLRTEVEALRRSIAEADLSEPQRTSAQERVSELEVAVTAEKPDLNTMEYVWNWFRRNLPTFAGAVTSVVVNPIVGKLVAAAGDALSADFRRRFGGATAKE